MMGRTKAGLSTRDLIRVTISPEQEHDLAQRWVKFGDKSARDLLVRAQFQHVYATARRYKHHTSATLNELIAEGNFGLVKALSKFDPDRGTRFATYAVYWIRSYISQYLVRSRSLVSSGTQSKALARVRRTRDAIIRAGGETDDVNEQVAARLAVTPEKLHSFLERMEAHDVPWDATTEGATRAPLSGRDSLSYDAEERLIAAETGERLSKAVALVVSNLDRRERYIVQQRLMAAREEALSLAEIGRRFGVSRERARQLELRALRKVRAGLACLSQDAFVERPAA
ncbi:MAG TPA: sigma-70 family RNA polymerase sigma factor [Polyangiaceae bacterium]|jgi:RNA polymerase sigma-32 factor|nr:sigma-70 family RNA polymerase sigma factor [Polyangiaceae bacterium]